MEKIKHTPPQFKDVKKTELDFRDVLETANRRRDEYKERRMYQERARITIPTKWPFSTFFIGDVHFGSVYTDNDKFIKDINAIRETPNAFIILMSNLIDNGNPTRFPDNMLSNSMSPHEQAKGMNYLLKTLDQEGKILGAIKSPCHEGWLWKNAGIDMNELLFQGTSFPKLDNGGILELETANQTYKIALFHQFGPFGSHFNKSHPAQQMMRLVLQGEPDVVALAHSHYGEALQTFYGVGDRRRDVVYVRTGTYKGNVVGKVENPPDMFMSDRSGTDGEPGAESVMFNPIKREMQAFLNIDTAIKYQQALYHFAQSAAQGALGLRK